MWPTTPAPVRALGPLPFFSQSLMPAGKISVRGNGLQRAGRHHHTAQGRTHRRRGQSHRNDGAPQCDVLHVQLIRSQGFKRGGPPQLDGHCDVNHNAHHRGPNGALGNADRGSFKSPLSPKPAAMPVNAGKMKVNTSKNENRFTVSPDRSSRSSAMVARGLKSGLPGPLPSKEQDQRRRTTAPPRCTVL